MSRRFRPARLVRRPPPGADGIPDATVARLPVYLRALTALAERGVETVSSEELAAAAGVNSAKLRKDLSHLGSYGTRGVGYDVEYLVYQISRELGLTQDWRVVIVGVGNLGHALANYGGFASRGFRVVALLDADPRRVGEQIAGLADPPGRRARAGRRASASVQIGVIATPAEAAQGVCDRLVAAGVTSMLNFAPCVLAVPDGVDVRKVDLVDRAADPRVPRAAQVATRLAVVPPRGGGDGGGPVSVLVVGLSHRTAPVACSSASPSTRRPLERSRPLVRSDARRRGRGPGDLQPARGLRRRRPVPRRRRRRRRAAGRRRPACRSTELTAHLYVHYEDRAVAAPVRGRLRAGLDGRRRERRSSARCAPRCAPRRPAAPSAAR